MKHVYENGAVTIAIFFILLAIKYLTLLHPLCMDVYKCSFSQSTRKCLTKKHPCLFHRIHFTTIIAFRIREHISELYVIRISIRCSPHKFLSVLSLLALAPGGWLSLVLCLKQQDICKQSFIRAVFPAMYVVITRCILGHSQHDGLGRGRVEFYPISKSQTALAARRTTK